ncbi:DUF5590 domain-containing protein [Halobacillus sp. Marseille-Q1614]|uniref:cell wall elongation regulator TseB-like domain-containing protein n=1 Tax=Halobacillus sp. Marseille-Q1614 TaxID=2709134 RepID=UPI001570F134|nr:DUF5590 domain-containing protein [Halobacillus sp. Marseille-Q1614]
MKMIGTQPSSQFTAPSWVKWALLITGILFVIIFTLCTWMYLHINDSKTQNYDKAKTFAKEEAGFNQVDNVTRYNGQTVIHIVNGTTKDGEDMYAFINVEEMEVLSTLSSEQMISGEALRSEIEAGCSSCEWVDTQLAFEENRPVWELTYKDDSNRYVFEYIDVENGEQVQRFAFRQP